MLLKAVELTRKGLRSNTVRTAIGERIYDANALQGVTGVGGSNIPNILTRIISLVNKLGGFLSRLALRAGKFTFVGLWSGVTEAVTNITYFDWNQTDAEVEATIKAGNNSVATALGGLVGTGLVWTVGIALAGAAVTKFPVLAGEVALRLAEEGGQEVKAQLNNVLATSISALLTNVTLGGLLTLRKLKLYGLTSVTEEKKPWTLAGDVDERKQKISPGLLRSFVDGFTDQLVDSILEMGYVVAFTLDDFYAAQQSAMSKDPVRTVIIEPDKTIPEEKIIIKGEQEALTETVQTVLSQHTLIANRDVGTIVGTNYDDWYKAKPFRRSLKILFKSKKEPPWKLPDGSRASEAEVNIPDVKAGLSWDKIKKAAAPYTWGPINAQWDLDNGRQLMVNAASRAEATKKLKELLALTTANPIKPIRFTETDDDNLPPELKKRPRQMYPAYANLTVRESSVGASDPLTTYKKNKKAAKTRILLHVDKEPEDFEPIPS